MAYSGVIFVFCNRSRTHLRLLFYDSQGLWVATKRLSQGRFSWLPNSSEAGSKLRGAMETWYTVAWELEHGQMSLKRLKEIFGTQGSPPAFKQNNDIVTESDEAEPDKNPPE